MFEKSDVERIVHNVLQDLVLEVETGSFVEPNTRTITLLHNGHVISRASFDVVQKREYEG